MRCGAQDTLKSARTNCTPFVRDPLTHTHTQRHRRGWHAQLCCRCLERSAPPKEGAKQQGGRHTTTHAWAPAAPGALQRHSGCGAAAVQSLPVALPGADPTGHTDQGILGSWLQSGWVSGTIATGLVGFGVQTYFQFSGCPLSSSSSPSSRASG